MNTKLIGLITCIATISISCQQEMTESGTANANVCFSIETTGQTRSSLNPDVNTLNDINIMAYKNGYLESCLFSHDLNNIKMMLAPGKYDFYAIGNLGKEFMAPALETDMKDWRYSITSTSRLALSNSVFSAFCEAEISNKNTPIKLVMIRLLSRCGFKFNASELPGMKVTAVRLCQAALDVTPFLENGSTPLNVEETGDYASEADITSINTGGTAYFYTLENAQGKLIDGNTDQWNKVPENIPEKAGQCTYIEVTAGFSDSPDGYSGSVLYRFYLGYDTVSDFTLNRNTEYTVSLIASKDGLDKVSWLIDTSDLGFDPLYGLEMPSSPEYVGQWSKMSLPSASEKNHAAIKYKGNSIAVGQYGDGKVQSITLDNGIRLYYAPAVSTTDIFIYASTYTESTGGALGSFTVESSGRSVTIDMATPKWPLFIAKETGSGQVLKKAELNEDGYEIAEFDLSLGDRAGNTLKLSSFAIPDEAIATALGYESETGEADIMGRFIEDFIDNAEIGKVISSASGDKVNIDGMASGRLKVAEDHNSMIDTDIAAHGILYGFKSGSTVLSICRQSDKESKLGIRTDINCSVAAAFPGQRFLGEHTNTQLSINSLSRDAHIQHIDLDIYNGQTGSNHASWECIRISPEAGNTVLNESILNQYRKKGHDNMELVRTDPDHFSLDLLPPKPDNSSTSQNSFFASGAFCIKGSVTNPYTNQTIYGYYTIDIILEFSVIAQVDFLSGYIGFYYVPYNVCYAHWNYSYSWQHNMPLVIIPETLAEESAVEGKKDIHQSFIPGDKPIGLVPIPNKTYSYSYGQQEYRIYVHNNNYEENNNFPFAQSNENQAISLLWGNISISEHEDETGIDVSQALKFTFGVKEKNGNITKLAGVKELSITRSNYTSYPAFEGFYRITKEYDGKYSGTTFNKIGYYVIEASTKAQSLKSPFYSSEL